MSSPKVSSPSLDSQIIFKPGSDSSSPSSPKLPIDTKVNTQAQQVLKPQSDQPQESKGWGSWFASFIWAETKKEEDKVENKVKEDDKGSSAHKEESPAQKDETPTKKEDQPSQSNPNSHSDTPSQSNPDAQVDGSIVKDQSSQLPDANNDAKLTVTQKTVDPALADAQPPADKPQENEEKSKARKTKKLAKKINQAANPVKPNDPSNSPQNIQNSPQSSASLSNSKQPSSPNQAPPSVNDNSVKKVDDILIVQKVEITLDEEGSWIPNWLLGKAINQYDVPEDKVDSILKEQREIMEKPDPQFRELFDFIHPLLLSSLDKIKLPGKTPIIKRLSSVILSRLFGILIKRVEANKHKIKGYETNTSLTNILSYLCIVDGVKDNFKSFSEIEIDYKNSRKNYRNLVEKLKIDPKHLSLLQNYVNTFYDLQLVDPDSLEKKRLAIKKHRESLRNQLFVNEKNIDENLIKEFLDTIEQLRERKNIIKQKFALISSNIITDLLPNGLKTIPELNGYIINKFGSTNVITKFLTSNLIKIYESMKSDPVLIDGWKDDLKSRIGPDLNFNSLVKAPTDLLFAYVKNGIQTDPRVIQAATSGLCQVKRPDLYPRIESKNDQKIQDQADQNDPAKLVKEDKKANLPEDKAKQLNDEKELKIAQLLSELSYKKLATWLITSAQTILVDNDSNFNGIRSFIEQALNNLTLGFMAEATKLGIDKTVAIDKNQFFKVMIERTINKIKDLTKDKKSLPDFGDLVQFFPLPEQIKALLAPFLAEKSVEGIKELEKFAEVKKLQEATSKEVEKYDDKKQLLKVVENSSHLIVDTAIENNSTLISFFGFNETLDELFAHYLPNTQIDQNLKAWFKDNYVALGSSQAAELLKRGLQTLLLKGLDNTVKKSKVNKSKDLLKQLITKGLEVLTKASKDIDNNQQIDKALELKAKINKKKNKIQDIKNNIAKKLTTDDGLTAQQIALLEKEIQINSQKNLALTKITELTNRKQLLLDLINQGKANEKWTDLHFAGVSKAMRLREKLLSGFLQNADNEEIEDNTFENSLKEIDERNQFLMKRIDELTKESPKSKTLKILKKLLKEKPEQIEQIFEIAQIQEMLSLCNTSVTNLANELSSVHDQVTNFDPNNFIDPKGDKKVIDPLDPSFAQNQQAWVKAKKWKNAVLSSKEEIKKISDKMTVLEKELDAVLDVFQKMSNELIALIGLDNKEAFQLPPLLKDMVWPYLEEAKDKLIPRFLFNYMAPLLIAKNDIQTNKDELNKISNNPNMGELIQSLSKLAIEHLLPNFITDNKTFAKEILLAVGRQIPSEEEISNMEAALENTLIDLGKKKLNKDILKPLIETTFPHKEKDLMRMIAKSKNRKITAKEVLAIIAPKSNLNKDKEIAEALTSEINFHLYDLGKEDLHSKDLIIAYESMKNGKQSPKPLENVNDIIKTLEDKEIVKKMQAVLITPDKIAHMIDSIIPGSSQLILPHIQALITNKDSDFKDTREFINKCIEGIVLKLFLDISKAESEGGTNPITALLLKFKNLIFTTKPDDNNQKSIDECADEFLKMLLVIKDDQGNDIYHIFRWFLFKFGRMSFRTKFSSLQKVVENTQEEKTLLNQKSGSKFLTSLSQAFSKDIVKQNLDKFKKDDIIEIIKALTPQQDLQETEKLAEEIVNVINHSKNAIAAGADLASSFVEGVLLKVFTRIAEKFPATKEKDTIFLLTEKLLEVIVNKYEEAKSGKDFNLLAQELNDTILKELLLIDSPEVFIGLPQWVQQKIFDILKNQIKEFTVKIKENLFTLEKNPLDNSPADQSSGKEAKDASVSKKVYSSILAADLANMLVASVPHVLAENVEGGIKGVTIVFKTIEDYLEDLALKNVEVAKTLLEYTQLDQFKQLLGSKLTSLNDKNLFKTDKVKAAQLLTNGLLKPLDEVIKKADAFETKKPADKIKLNQELMADLLNEFADHLKNLNDAKELAVKDKRKDIQFKDFVKAVDKLEPGVSKSPIDYVKTISAIEKRIDVNGFSADQKKKWEQEKATLLKAIKSMVRDENKGIKAINYKDFFIAFDPIYKKVMGANLTDSQKDKLWVGVNKITLKKIIRQEANKIDAKRTKARQPAIESLMNLLFPNGEKDLSFVPDELKTIVWNQFKNNLFPLALQIFNEVMFDPNTINSMVLSSLETLNENLSEPIVIDNTPPRVGPLDELDKVSGKLITEIMKSVKLPAWAKKLVVDPKTGEATDEMKRILGATLRKKFNDVFLKDMVELAMTKFTERDSKGKPFFNFEPMSTKEMQSASKKKAVELKAKLKTVSRETVDTSISYYFRNRWALFKNRMGKAWPKLAKVGSRAKNFLQKSQRVNAFCNLIFVKIFGTLIKLVTLPITWTIKEIIYKIISLDANRDQFLGMLTTIPDDQPEIENQYVIFHENLAAKIRRVLNTDLKKFA